MNSTMDISNRLASRKRKNSIKHEAGSTEGPNFAISGAIKAEPVDVSIDGGAGVIDIDYGAVTKIPKLEKDDDTTKLRIEDTDESSSDSDEVLNLIGEFLASSTTSENVTSKRKRGKKQGKNPKSKQKSTSEATKTAEAPRKLEKDVSGDESNSYSSVQNFKCEVCGKFMWTVHGLARHRSIVHAERENHDMAYGAVFLKPTSTPLHRTMGHWKTKGYVTSDKELKKILNLPYIGQPCGIEGCTSEIRFKCSGTRKQHWRQAHNLADFSKLINIEPIWIPCGFPTCFRIFSSSSQRRAHINKYHVRIKY